MLELFPRKLGRLTLTERAVYTDKNIGLLHFQLSACTFESEAATLRDVETDLNFLATSPMNPADFFIHSLLGWHKEVFLH